jgi:signal transduction histidine kinase
MYPLAVFDQEGQFMKGLLEGVTMKLHAPFRLRFMIPLLVLSISLLIDVFETRERLVDQEKQFLHFSRNVMESKMNLLQSVLTDLIPNGDVETAQERLNYATRDRQIVTMIFTDEEHRVRLSNRPELLAASAPGTCRYDKAIAETGRSARSGKLISLPGQVDGYYPIALTAQSSVSGPPRYGTLYVEYDFSKPLAQARQEAYRDAARRASLLLFFSLLLSALLYLLITRHIERLLKVVQDVAGGNLSARTEIRGTGELAQLARALDDMAEQLAREQEALQEQAVELEAEVAERQAAQESLQDQAVALEEEIMERQSAQAEIERLNAELEQRVLERTAQLKEANHELEAFSYSVSHDLRAPLRSIDGFSQALLEDYQEKLDDQGKDFLRRVRAASQHMAGLIDDMLKLSRVTRGAMKCEPVDLSAMARWVVEEIRRTEPDRNVEFCIQDSLAARGDQHLLRMVLANLLGNAWKFTSKSDKAKIEFGLTTTGGTSEYFVRDNGAGFDMQYADKLFAPFQRLHAYSEFSGTGIGLSIVQRIIHRHGGEVRAEGAPGHGATIYFTLQ